MDGWLVGLEIATGWVVLAFITIAGGAIVYNMWSGGIDMSRIISEPNGDASMSRFQLLIFTFVIAVSLFLVIVATHGFPPIPQGVLVLLGISGSSYLVSKGIQFSSPQGIVEGDPAVIVTPQRATVAAGQTLQFTATTVKTPTDKVLWSIDPSTGNGSITQDGLYTAPTTKPATCPFVAVHATSADKSSLVDVAFVQLV